jgi:hypothetical protein
MLIAECCDDHPRIRATPTMTEDTDRPPSDAEELTEEQKRRFLERIDMPEKNWKFSVADVHERAHWKDYMAAYEDMFNHTSTTEAPWYIIPADNKWFMRAAVAEIVVHHLEDMDPQFPVPTEEERAAMAEAVKRLRAEE